MLPATLQFLVAMITCAISDRKQWQLAYCLEEVRVLKEALKDLSGSTRIAFTAEQRRRLAIKGKDLSPKERKECCQIVRPEMILAWFRQLAARKFDSSKAKNRVANILCEAGMDPAPERLKNRTWK